ncbi:hypothetical protein LWI29_021179 [Acer saccharum]|uniref:Xaa-Pro dipeptidyl-peptidase-like domain-containing protein n=1 Tax=Acer saccharum TaxID=4024 RepID=A0AA39TBN6_ACESA|nr:hypothetical protein LWI29_021179 [Acer saccharum]
MSSITVESSTVDTSDGVKLYTRVFKPREELTLKDNLLIVLVHPYSVLGGCQGLLKGMASGFAANGYKAVTFDMRGVGRSTGKASLTGSSEVKDVIAVANGFLTISQLPGSCCWVLLQVLQLQALQLMRSSKSWAMLVWGTHLVCWLRSSSGDTRKPSSNPRNRNSLLWVLGMGSRV